MFSQISFNYLVGVLMTITLAIASSSKTQPFRNPNSPFGQNYPERFQCRWTPCRSSRLDDTGHCWAFGCNRHGQCQLPENAHGPVVAVAAGNRHTLTLTGDGQVLSCGENGEGQCDVPAPGNWKVEGKWQGAVPPVKCVLQNIIYHISYLYISTVYIIIYIYTPISIHTSQ